MMQRILLLVVLTAHILLPASLHAETLPADPNQARLLMDEGRAAILREDYPAAVRTFDSLLALPPNAYSRDALEFLGLASERRGDIKRARDSYERYLALYPEGPDAQRILQRIGNLPTAKAKTEALRAPRARQESETLVYGGLSQTYYRGNTHIDTRTTINNFVDQATLSLTDQSSLITSLDLTVRERGPNSENRFVFRDTHLKNFLSNQDDINRLTAAYYEHRSKPTDFSLRIGRQPALGGGVLGRFDGGQLGFGLSPKWRLNLVGGEPADSTIDSNRSFVGINTDIGGQGIGWSGNVYVIKQEVDGLADREAVGTEIRHFTPASSVFALIDYDTLFSEPNIGLLQGYWQVTGGGSYNLLVDWRKAPSLQTSTAVMGETTSSVSALMQILGLTEAQMVDRASALTAVSKLFSIGYTKPVNTTWQLGTDFRVSRTSATLGSPTVPPAPDTGNLFMLTEQVIGTGLFAKRDITILSVSVIRASPYDGLALSALNRSLFGKNWTLDANLRWYKQTNEPTGDMVRVTPTVRTTYRWKENMSFELEVGVERTETNSPTVNEINDREYFSLGYRWDF